GTTANILLPLYAVVAGGVVAYILERARGSADGWRERAPSTVELALVGYVVLRAPVALLERLRAGGQERGVLLRAVRPAAQAAGHDQVVAPSCDPVLWPGG